MASYELIVTAEEQAQADRDRAEQDRVDHEYELALAGEDPEQW